MSTTTSRHAPLDEVAALARPVVAGVIWATLATVGPDGRPRTRNVHPVLRWDDPPTGWITSRPTALRRRHLAACPFVSLGYWSPAHDVVAVDCHAEWVDRNGLEVAWESIRAEPGPAGFDPATIWPDGPSSPTFAVIRLRAHRVRVSLALDAARGDPAAIWSVPSSGPATGAGTVRP